MSRVRLTSTGSSSTAVDLGGRGIVLSEPSVVARDSLSGAVRAASVEAERMIGRTPATISRRVPLADGVIADFAVTEGLPGI